MIKVILWDIDGTLMDFLAAEKVAIRSCFGKFTLGECSDEMLQAYSKINVKYWEALERGEMSKPEILVERFREFFKVYGLDESVADAFNAEYQVRLGDTICFYPYGMEMVKVLQGKVLQCAVTNGTKVAQKRKLEGSGLDRILDYVFISEEVGFEKPSKEFFQQVFEVIGVETDSSSGENGHRDRLYKYTRDEVLIVGDSITSDMKGGYDAGIKTCYFNPLKKENKLGIPVDYEITNLREVGKILYGENWNPLF